MGKFDNWDNNLLSLADRAKSIHTIINPMVLYWLLVYYMATKT